ncbi:YybH family protein [Allomuricauda sp. CP2A]|jgi:ketosteroid isomerase-like protein|uniref:YybH family protein n=1 Tax=Allomuricauda sp. CP2A TaxID=1848189 RepID=UPI000830B2AC|nr:nuclear transport factor 2 family protein [Muricauda sp. CP2A]
MKNITIIGVLMAVVLFTSCTKKEKEPSDEMMAAWKQEITDAEAAFAQMAKEEGMNKAFLAFAADNAVLMRGNQLIEKKTGIAEYMKNQNSKGLAWSPEFVDVAKSGDLGYTYGYYTFNYEDQEGNPAEAKGVFHTVWKRQQDGSWKFVWD